MPHLARSPPRPNREKRERKKRRGGGGRNCNSKCEEKIRDAGLTGGRRRRKSRGVVGWHSICGQYDAHGIYLEGGGRVGCADDVVVYMWS